MGSVKKGLIILFLLVFATSCSLLQIIKDNPWSEMTPKERAILMEGEYNAMYRDYKAQAARATLTEPERIVLREKKKLFAQVYPLIKMYESYVDNGLQVTPDMENQITTILNQLGSTIIQKLME